MLSMLCPSVSSARHEFRHLTTVPSVYGRLSVLGFNSTLLPRGHDQAALDVL